MRTREHDCRIRLDDGARCREILVRDGGRCASAGLDRNSQTETDQALDLFDKAVKMAGVNPRRISAACEARYSRRLMIIETLPSKLPGQQKVIVHYRILR